MKSTIRKVIGIMPLYDDEKESYWMLPGYMKMLEAENAIPMMLPLTANEKELDYFLEICGGFLLTGGHDVSPSVYHEKKKSWCGSCCELRDVVLCQDLVQVKMRNFSHFNPPEAQPQCVFFHTIVRIHLVTYSCNGYEFVSYCRKLPDIQKSTGMPAYNRGF